MWRFHNTKPIDTHMSLCRQYNTLNQIRFCGPIIKQPPREKGYLHWYNLMSHELAKRISRNILICHAHIVRTFHYIMFIWVIFLLSFIHQVLLRKNITHKRHTYYWSNSLPLKHRTHPTPSTPSAKVTSLSILRLNNLWNLVDKISSSTDTSFQNKVDLPLAITLTRFFKKQIIPTIKLSINKSYITPPEHHFT